MTGCSSCQRTREFLLREKVDFESVNLAETPDRIQDLEAFGIRSVPVLIKGDQFTRVMDLADVAKFVGARMTHKMLPPDQLVGKMDEILASAIANAGAVPEEKLGASVAGRERPHRDLIHHIFRNAEAFVEAADGAKATDGRAAADRAPKDITRQGLLDYGSGVRQQFAQWWSREADRYGVRLISSYAGEKPMHVVLERATWHCAHHTRQLEVMVLGGMGIAAPRPLDQQTLAGLPLPETVF